MFFFSFLFRPSGTEGVVRVYAEAENQVIFIFITVPVIFMIH